MTRSSWQAVVLLAAGAAGGFALSTMTAEARGDGVAPTEVLAEVGGTRITRAEVEGTSPEGFLILARQRHGLTEQSLVQAVRVRLVEVEAAARGIPGAQLVQEEVYDRTPDPTDAEVEAVFRRSGSTAPLSQVAEQIRRMLKNENQNVRYDEFLAELREKHAVVSHLEPMRSAVPTEGPWRGTTDAPVTIVEYGDFQCPYCRELVGVLGQVMDAYGDQVRLVYRQFPLTNIHPAAQIAAEASLCANDQGHFWELHDQMYANPAVLSDPYLKGVARQIGMDGAVFDACLDGRKYRDQVVAEAAEARALGLTGTPGLFINGRFMDGVPTAEAMAEIILDELLRKDIEIEPRRIEPIRVAVDAEGFPAKGPADAPVTIVEFADFQCPYCLRILPALEEVVATYGDRVRFVYRQFPIAALHPEAEKAAEASLCADEQGRFWEMHDAMFAAPGELPVPVLKTMARSIGVEGSRFDECLDSGRYADEVAADIEAGRRAGVSGTPALFINGRALPGLQGFEAISQVIEDELSRRGN